MTNSGFGFTHLNNYESSVAIPGMTSMFAPENAPDQQLLSDDHIVQGNCLMVANSSSQEFKLKYSMIAHSHG
jgi:hypothetical protein